MYSSSYLFSKLFSGSRANRVKHQTTVQVGQVSLRLLPSDRHSIHLKQVVRTSKNCNFSTQTMAYASSRGSKFLKLQRQQDLTPRQVNLTGHKKLSRKVSNISSNHIPVSKSLKNSDVVFWKLYSRKLIPQTFQTAKFTKPQTNSTKRIHQKVSNCRSRFETFRKQTLYVPNCHSRFETF